MTYFFFQSFSDIRTELGYLERGPLTLQAVLALAFKVYHERDE